MESNMDKGQGSPADSNEELREHLRKLLTRIEPDSPRHEEVDTGIAGDELL